MTNRQTGGRTDWRTDGRNNQRGQHNAFYVVSATSSAGKTEASCGDARRPWFYHRDGTGHVVRASRKIEEDASATDRPTWRPNDDAILHVL